MIRHPPIHFRSHEQPLRGYEHRAGIKAALDVFRKRGLDPSRCHLMYETAQRMDDAGTAEAIPPDMDDMALAWEIAESVGVNAIVKAIEQRRRYERWLDDFDPDLTIHMAVGPAPPAAADPAHSD